MPHPVGILATMQYQTTVVTKAGDSPEQRKQQLTGTIDESILVLHRLWKAYLYGSLDKPIRFERQAIEHGEPVGDLEVYQITQYGKLRK